MQINKTLSLSKDQYYETHLALCNCLLPVKMTPKEIEVLARFMALDGSIAEDRFGTSARKIVKESLGLSDGGLGNFLSSLRKKRFIYLNPQNKLTIFPLLVADTTTQSYSFTLENNNQ